MSGHILISLRATFVIAVLTGLLFPALITLIAQVLFPEQANGSLIIRKNGEIVGSKLIGQQFSKPEFFHARPSAAGSSYAGEASGGTNLGPCSSKLVLGLEDDPASVDKDESFAGIKQLTSKYRLDNLLEETELPPVDAVTRSASGLDPHISEANAFLQARRVAKVRGIAASELKQLIEENTEPRQLGFLGEPGVNVLMLNLALERRYH